jgi:hypothetical protein
MLTSFPAGELMLTSFPEGELGDLIFNSNIVSAGTRHLADGLMD